MPRMEFACRRLLALAAALLLLPCAAYAQVLYGSLTGTVTDPTQAAVPNSSVEALNTATGVARQTTTNTEGIYLFADLQPGTYKVSISSPSFTKVVREGVVIEANRVRRVDAALEVARVAEAVLVTGAAEALQTDRADVNLNVTSRQVTDLPFTGGAGRNFQSLMIVIPGAVMTGEQNSAAGSPQRAISFNVNGVSRLQNNTRIDGASVTYPWLPTNLAYVPPAEAIEAVNIVTNAYTAEQGIAGGAAINVITKAGTNDFHGSGWLYNTNSKFKSRSYFQTTPQNPKDILNQFGFTFGGPVWIPKLFNGRNKLFFFVDWERTTRRNTSPVRFYNLPTNALRAGDFSGVGSVIYDPASSADPARRTPFPGNRIPSDRIDVAATELIARMPQPNVPNAEFVNNYTAGGVGTFDRDNVDVKINHQATQKLAYFGRYSISPHNIFDPPALGEAGGDALNGGSLGYALGRTQVIGVGVTYTATPTVLVDVNLGYTRQRLGAENVDIDRNYGLEVLKIPDTNGPDRIQGGFPSFQFNNQVGGGVTAGYWANMGNPNTGNPFLFRDNQYLAGVNLSWTKGAHGLRFGYNHQYQQLNHFQPQGGTFQTIRGTFQFNGNMTGLQNGAAPDRFNSWADFLLGLPARAGKVDQLRNPNSLYMRVYGLYAQDQWQVTRRLTLTYGVRWERYPFPKRDWGGVSRFDPADGNVYLGGLGGVPEDTGADSGRGQLLPRAGIAYRVTERTVVRAGYGMSADPRPFIEFRNAYPVVNAWEVTPPTNPYLWPATLRQGLQQAIYGRAPDFTQGVIPLPVSTSTSTFPREVMRKYIQSWNFMVQREIASGLTAQAGYVGTRATGQMNLLNINSAPPGGSDTGRMLFSRFGLRSDINMVMPFQTTTYDGLQTQLTRRWGGSQVGAVYTFSKAINWADNDTNLRIQWPGAWGLNRGRASYDRTHNWQTFWVVDTPFGKGRRWSRGPVLDRLLGGWQWNGILSAMSGFPIYVVQNSGMNLNAPGSSQVPDQVKQNVEIRGGVGTGALWFDPSAYQIVNIPSGQPQRFGNAGRNNINGPRFFNVDTGLFRTIDLTERFHVQLRAEAFNILNHPNFGTPGQNGQSGNNVSDPSTFGKVLYTVGSNGASSNAGVNTGERQFRFAIRVFF